ncbi:MAG: hypothetical protein IJ026_06595 [Candidatus Methanomethylophilaceae archaeon]|nr:hypothetical protein [Candidatus Methanomethylophilaceae archaeon]
MVNVIDSVPFGDGVRITRLVSTDRDIVVPDTVDGMPVVSIGGRFMMGSPVAESRTVTVPASVTDMHPDAFSGIMGLCTVRYLGGFDVLNGFGLETEYDCTLEALVDGRTYSFAFPSGSTMSFPAFDDAMVAAGYRMTPEIAMGRLSDPVLLTDANREAYASYMRRRIIPMAEHSVMSNDPDGFMHVVSTGLLSDADLRNLLERSLLSGRTSMTSTVMSVIRRRTVGTDGED